VRAQVDAARAAVARLQLAHLAAQLRVGVVAHPLERLQDLPGAQLARRVPAHGGIGIVCVAQQRGERLAVHGRPSMAAGL
jgi:hypothetical protein